MKQSKKFEIQKNNSKESFKNALNIVHLFRKKNKFQREISDIGKKIRDNQKRILLINNLNEYIKPEMKYKDIKNIIINMKSDYEDRIDDYVMKCAEISKEKKKIINELKIIRKSKKNI